MLLKRLRHKLDRLQLLKENAYVEFMDKAKLAARRELGTPLTDSASSKARNA